MTKKHIKGLVQLLFISIFFWFFSCVFTPWWISYSPEHQRFLKALDDYDIPIGALYYTDVPISEDAERHVRHVWLNRKKTQAKIEALAKKEALAKEEVAVQKDTTK